MVLKVLNSYILIFQKVIVNLFSKYLAYYVFKIIRINDKQNDLSIVSMKILHVIVLFLTLPGEQHSELI